MGKNSANRMLNCTPKVRYKTFGVTSLKWASVFLFSKEIKPLNRCSTSYQYLPKRQTLFFSYRCLLRFQ